METRCACTTEDSAALFTFLERHTETSLFLLGNLSEKGIGDAAAHYVMAKHNAAVVGVVSVTAAGYVLVQAPNDAAELVSLALQRPGSPINGMIGPTAQIAAVLDGLSLRQTPARLHSDERVYGRDLQTFSANVSPDAEVRLADPLDVDVLTKLRRAFLIEAVGVPDSPAADAAARAEADRMCRDGATFVLVERGEETRKPKRHRAPESSPRCR